MLQPDDRLIAEELKNRLIAAGIPLEELRVYGSRARGDHGPESDLDVCLILREYPPAIEASISRTAWEVGFAHERIIMTVEFTPDQIQHSPLRVSPFLHAIEAEGVTV